MSGWSARDEHQDRGRWDFSGKTDPQIVTELLASTGDPGPHPPERVRSFCDRYVALLERELADALAVEDSPTGVSSATAAGVPVLAVPHVLPVAEAAGRVVHPTLDGVDLAFLRRLFAA